jgi:putative membrane protein
MFMPHHEPFGPLGILFGALGGLSWLALVAGAVLLVIWAVRAIPGAALVRSNVPAAETPHDMLARRFASGEISAEEYERSRDLLRGDSAKP